MFDTHAHLNHEQFQADRSEVLARAQRAGVLGIVVVGFDLPSSALAVEMADPDVGLHAAVGVHPHDATTVTAETIEQLRRLADHAGVVAVGETGLDFYRNLSPKQTQIEGFRRHIELAAQKSKTLVVHDREAHDEVLDTLERYAPPHLRVVLHCFSGDFDMLAEAEARGYWIGIAGNVTYPNAHALREVVRSVSTNRLLVETDCPYLPPQAYRKRMRNEPAFMKDTLMKLAAARNQDVAEIERQTTENARRAFGIGDLTSCE